MIKAIYISKERNGILESPPEVDVVAGRGIVGDRYFEDGNRKSPDYEITFIEAEKIDEYNLLSGENIGYGQPRRNVLTVGINLGNLIGKAFRIGNCAFAGIGPCDPCELLRSRTSPRAFKWFRGKGGLRAGITGGGIIRIGDAIELLP